MPFAIMAFYGKSSRSKTFFEIACIFILKITYVVILTTHYNHSKIPNNLSALPDFFLHW